MILIPAIDVLEGALVRLVEGNYDEATHYGTDPAAAARRWVDAGAGLVHIVDLGAARSGGLEAQLILCDALRYEGVPFQIGGGIRSLETATSILAAGARRVVIGTAALSPDGPLRSIIEAVGPEQVVVAVDVRDGRARGSGWLDEGEELSDVLTHLKSCGVIRILLTGITRDGRMEGPDLGLLSDVQNAWPEVAIIASGGVGSLQDVKDLADAGYESAVVGRALFESRFSLEEGLGAASASG